MEKRQATDIDRKLAIYYHPLFQEIIKHLLHLFNLDEHPFEIGLLEFVEFNLKLQKSLLPAFEIDNALVSALNDWVKQVAECLSYEGMVSTSNCEEITSENFRHLLEKELGTLHIDVFAQREQYLKALTRLGSHDAFKLLGVRINKEVYNKFVFDLCSTWCEFLDIELFTYFLIAIYVQISQGTTLATSQFKPTEAITPIDLEFMEEFEEIKAIYSKNKKKELRYYRAWCEWNYLRINDIGEALILQLDQVHEHDSRILELALIFERSIKVINDQITNQNPQTQLVPQGHSQQPQHTDFLVAKKIDVPQERQKKEDNQGERSQIIRPEQFTTQEEVLHNFEIEIDADGNMFLKKIVKLPILGTRIEPEPAQRKEELRQQYLERKREEIRHISNLYRRMENMKVRLEHSVKNDPYTFKQSAKVAERNQFYQKEDNQVRKQPTNTALEKIIHGKVQPEKVEEEKTAIDYRSNFRPELMQEKEGIRKNEDYIHRVMAPSFLTDHKNTVSYIKGEGDVYGIGPYAEKRDLKLGLPRLKFLDKKVQPMQSYHLVGKLTKDRSVINQRVRSFTAAEPVQTKLEKQREQYRHVWTRYISEDEMKELSDYQDFYQKLEEAKKKFSSDHQSDYRLNLKNILLYENKRYQMGGVISKKQEEHFYERIRKLIKRDLRRQVRKKKKHRLREYRKAVGGKEKRKLFEDIFISYHRTAIKSIKDERRNASIAK